MSDFKVKMHQIVCRPRLRPRPRWGSLQRSPRRPTWILGGLLVTWTERDERGREGEGGEGKGEQERRKEGKRERGGMGKETRQGRPPS